ncbi:MAG: hypothetical protein GY861_23820, partial [bacterium]|nr:hypothetical protein [bacterium]
SPEEALIDNEDTDCWVKVPVIGFQAIAGETMYAFISGYLFPKISLFNPERWGSLKGQRLRHPGLEHCVLAMGPMKYSPWYIAKILESHVIQSNGACPGTDIHLKEYLQETFSEDFLEFYEGTLQPAPSTTTLFKEVFQKEKKNKLRLRCLGAIIKWRKLHARDLDNVLKINHQEYYMGGNYISLRVDQNPSSEGSDHHFRAILHHILQIIFYPNENKPLLLNYRNLLCQITF